MARPRRKFPKKLPEDTRSERLVVLLTPGEKAALEKEADDQGATLADVTREKLHIEHVNLGQGFKVLLGKPRLDGDAVRVVGALLHEGKPVESPGLVFRWVSDASVSMESMSGEDWAPPRGCDGWALSTALTALCAPVRVG